MLQAYTKGENKDSCTSYITSLLERIEGFGKSVGPKVPQICHISLSSKTYSVWSVKLTLHPQAKN